MTAPAARTARHHTVETLIDHGFCTVLFRPVIRAASAKLLGFMAVVSGPAGMMFTCDDTGRGRHDGPTGELVMKIDFCSLGASIRQGRELASSYRLFIDIHGISLAALTGQRRDFFNLIDELHLDPSCIVLALSETSRCPGIEELADLIRPFREAGVGIALGDVGMRQPWFQYIHRLEPDFAIINRSLTGGVDEDWKKQVILKNIAVMAKELGFKIIAHGVERVQEWFALEASGIEYATGSYLGEPDSAQSWLDRMLLGEPAGERTVGGIATRRLL